MLVMFLGLFHSSLGDVSNVKHYRNSTKQKVNPIDSIYNQLIADKASEVLLYNELFWGDKTKSIIAWKKLDTLRGIVLKSDSGVLSYKREIVICQKRLNEAVSLYFAEERRIADTLPQNPLGVSHDFEINIRSYQNGRQRSHKLLASQVIYFKNPFTIGKVANLFNDIIYFEESEGDKRNMKHETPGHKNDQH